MVGITRKEGGVPRKSPNYDVLRERMVREQLVARDITDPLVLKVMSEVPRHLFVPEEVRDKAYRDSPLPIGHDQTISQPYIVALMTQALRLRGHEVVLEVGTGSGYQTAILSRLAKQVFSIEHHAELAERAGQILAQLGYHNVEVLAGDGSQGLPDQAPFDAILVAAAAPEVPWPLKAQLAEGGRLVIPIGGLHGQVLTRVTRQDDHWSIEQLAPVMFVPLIGRYGWSEDDLRREWF
ncbi:MAG: protein-L-isoaspartate O-methyltransferase [Chloroflexota bacterium]